MRALLLAAILALSATAPALAGRPGTIDRTFADDGRLETRVPGGRPAVAGLKTLVGGRPLVVGTVGRRTIVLLRWYRAGLPDRGFGERGVTSLDLGADVTLGAVAFLRLGSVHDGDMLIAGGIGPESSPDRVAFVAKLTSKGTLDPSFGDGGIARTDFGGLNGDTVRDLAVGRSGAIVAAVESGDDLVVARYDSRGSLDPGFGDGGIARFTAEPLEHLTARAVALQGDRILVAGHHSFPRRTVPFVMRLLADGTPEPGFGDQDDRLSLPGDEPTVSDLVVEPRSGRALFAGWATVRWPAFWLAELAPEDEVVSVAHVAVRNRSLYGESLLVDGGGRRVIGGSVIPPRGGHGVFGVARVLPDGRRDRCFGRRGLARVAFPGDSSTLAAIDLDGRGRIVAAGVSARAFRLTRLWGGPRPGSSPQRTLCRSPRRSAAR